MYHERRNSNLMEILSSDSRKPLLISQRISIDSEPLIRNETYLIADRPRTEEEMKQQILENRSRSRTSMTLSKSHNSIRRSTLARLEHSHKSMASNSMNRLSIDDGILQSHSLMDILRKMPHDDEEESHKEVEPEYIEDHRSIYRETISRTVRNFLTSNRVMFPRPIHKIIQPKVYAPNEIEILKAKVEQQRAAQPKPPKPEKPKPVVVEPEPIQEKVADKIEKIEKPIEQGQIVEKKKSKVPFLIDKKYVPPSIREIKCLFGNCKFTVPVDLLRGICDGDIHEALEFDPKQTMYLRLKGLREKGVYQPKFIPFVRDPDILMYDAVLDRNFLKDLKSNITYALEFEDIRLAKVKELREDEYKQIHDVFNEIDVLKAGEVTFEEIAEYFNEEKEDKYLRALNLFEMRKEMTKTEEEVQELREGLKRRRDQLEKFYANKLQSMKASDVDNSGSISWEEFLCSEAYDIVKNRNK